MSLKKLVITVLVISILGVLSGLVLAQEASKDDYLIGAGDLIEISVWNHPELTKSMKVRPDGWVSFPLAGELLASNVKPAVLADQIRRNLLSYMKDPRVTVIVTEYNSKKILVLGEVKKPGLYQFEGGMTAFDAIGLAEGQNKHAQLKSIVVVRNVYAKTPQFYLVDLYTAIHDGISSGDVELQPKDIVYVPQNFIGNVADFTDYFMSRVRPAADTYFIAEVARNNR